MTYEEFRKDWYSKVSGVTEDGVPVTEELMEFFCECDYKRYIGEWKETL